MELVSGETLRTRIHQEKTDLRTLLGYLAQAARAWPRPTPRVSSIGI